MEQEKVAATNIGFDTEKKNRMPEQIPKLYVINRKISKFNRANN